MNPMEMVLTKDHVKALIHIIPNSNDSKKFTSFAPMDTMENYKDLQEHCQEM